MQDLYLTQDATDRLRAALTDRYRIERELGSGGMATVYLAQDVRHHRRVAVKVLRPELAAVIGAKRFLHEIETTASLQHPHILPLHDSGEVGGTAFYVMPHVDGESLRDRLVREKQLPIDVTVRIATEVASALDYAHRKGVIHRDIKPENILLHEGQALVADFGIALAATAAGGSRITETGMSLGTPHYMSPEQAMGEREITGRSDVYALGCVVYEMLTGEPPFTAATAQAIVARVLTEEPRPLALQRKTVPPATEAAVMVALQKLPADRFGTAAEFAAALAGGPSPTVRTRSVPAARSRPLPWPRISLGLGVISVALLALALWAVRREGPSAPAVYDAALPDSAAMSFGVTSSNAYGKPLRSLSISPAGDFAVYAARQGDSTELWYRSLRNSDARRLPGTRGGTAPRISPDGNRVAFLRSDRVMLLSLSGGEPRLVLDGRSTDALGWMSNTQISAATNDGNRFNWIDAGGGTPRAKTIPRCTSGRWVPELRQLLCSYNWSAILLDPESGAIGNIRVARPDGTAGELLAGTAFFLLDRHHLVYITGNGTMVGARYDPERRLAFRPVSLLGGIRREALGEAQFDIAANGTLVYAPGSDATIGRLVTLHAGGAIQPLPMESAVFQRFDLSHDRRWMAASVQGTESNELRIYDLQNGQHFTWLRAGWIRHPLWSASGEQLLFSVRDSTRWTILRGVPSSGAQPDTLATTQYDDLYSLDRYSLDPTDYDNDHLALAQSWGGSIVTRFDPSAPHPSFDTVLSGARFSSLSPNRKLILYQTLEGNQVLVTGFPVPGRRWQLASEGVEPLWLSGTDVLYRVGNAWYLVRINPETGEPRGTPTLWGRDPRFSDTSGWSNRPSRDGGILYVQGPAENQRGYLRVIPDWVRQARESVDGAGRD